MSAEMILEPTLNQTEEEEEVQVKPFARPADRAASGSRVQAVSVAREAEEIPAGFFRRLKEPNGMLYTHIPAMKTRSRQILKNL